MAAGLFCGKGCRSVNSCIFILENGVNIRQVQELLGHKDVKTTQIYTHVMNKDLNAVQSPLDTLPADKKRPEADRNS